MSVFFNYPLPYNNKIPANVEAWSLAPNQQTYLAASGANKKVSLFLDEGNLIDIAIQKEKSDAEPSAIAWHPKFNWFITGWSDGGLSHWNEKTRQRDEKSSGHRHGIVAISFNPAGTRCITTDSGGTCIIWAVDEQSHTIRLLKKTAKEGVINHIVWRSNSGRRADANPFFMAGSTGIVYSGDEQFSLMERQKLGNNIARLEYLDLEDRVVVVTNSGTVSSFQLDQEGGLVNAISFTVRGGASTAASNAVVATSKDAASHGSKPGFQACWIPDGALVTCHNSSLLRVWNVSTSSTESFVLPLTNEHGDRLLKESVTDVAFNPATRTLACLSSSGTLLQWIVGPPGANQVSTDRNRTFTAPSFGFSESSFLPNSCVRLALASSADSYEHLNMARRPGYRALAARTSQGYVATCVETTLARATAAPLAVVQNGPDSFLLQTLPLSGASPEVSSMNPRPKWEHLVQERSAAPPTPVLVKLDFKLKGLAVAPPFVAAWGANELSVYSVTNQAGDNLELHTVVKDITSKQDGYQEGGMLPAALASSNPLFAARHARIGANDVGLATLGGSLHIFVARGNRVEVWDAKGRVLKVIPVSAEDGVAERISVKGGVLATSTSKGKLLFWQLPARGAALKEDSDIKSLMAPRLISQNARCESISLNATGSQLAMVAIMDAATAATFLPDPRSGLDAPASAGLGATTQSRVPRATRLQRAQQAATQGSHMATDSVPTGCLTGTTESIRVALAFSLEHETFRKIETGPSAEPKHLDWDSSDPRILAMEAHPRHTFASSIFETDNLFGETSRSLDVDLHEGPTFSAPTRVPKAPELWSFVVAPDAPPTVQDFISLKAIARDSEGKDVAAPFFASLSIVLPFAFVFSLSGDFSESSGKGGKTNGTISRRVLQTFECLEKAQPSVYSALSEFCARLAGGDSEGAYGAVRSLKEPLVWSTLARMAVHTRRLDVAVKCLSLMESPIAATSARKALQALRQTPGVADYLRAVPKSEDNGVTAPVVDACHFDASVMHDVQLAVVAEQLGLVEEAAEILRNVKRHDLLINLFVRHGRWQEATREAELRDPMSLSSTRYLWAQHLEASGLYDAAAELYMQAATLNNSGSAEGNLESGFASGAVKVAKMFSQLTPELDDLNLGGSNNRLNDFVQKSQATLSDAETVSLHTWLARLWEAKGDLVASSNEFKRALAFGQLVSAYCSSGKVNEARMVVEDNSTPAACYALAQHLHREVTADMEGTSGNPPMNAPERKALIQEAIQLYGRSGAVMQALHLAERTGAVSPQDLLQLAINAPPRARAKSAAFFEQRGNPAAAALLYSKASQVEKAIEVCVRNKLGDTLKKIAMDLSMESVVQQVTSASGATAIPVVGSPEHVAVHQRARATLSRCGDLLVEFGFLGTAARVYAEGGLKQRAVEVLEQKIASHKDGQQPVDADGKPLIDEQVSETTIDKALPSSSEGDEAWRQSLLMRLGSVAKNLLLYQAACKCYTKAGDRGKAVKCLIRAGNVDAVSYFATKARDSAVYVLAANFLLSQDWRGNEDLTKNICTFYGKAKAYDKLVAFFAELANVEIDEFRAYDGALRAVDEGLRTLSKILGVNYDPTSFNPDNLPAPLQVDPRGKSLLRQRILVSRFLQAKKQLHEQNDLEGFVSSCETLLGERGLDEFVRQGDVFAEMVGAYAQTRQFAKAGDTLQRMVELGLQLDPYMETSLLENVMRNTGRRFNIGGGNGRRAGNVLSSASSH